MFKDPFSFEGRIRRSEYGISIIIYLLLYWLAIFLAIGIGNDPGAVIFTICMIPLLWFGLAQGAKRCHDIGNSGWWQLIPFYGLWMLFQDGTPGQNQYGENPKGIMNQSPPFIVDPQNPQNPQSGYQGGYLGGHNNPNTNYGSNVNPQNGSGYNDGDLYK
ncbi:MAG: DUF805 domain-containing protein [Bacteroidetes bacterium]|nr:DUF805 domain-containing protein [Bacteroidota bacterium]